MSGNVNARMVFGTMADKTQRMKHGARIAKYRDWLEAFPEKVLSGTDLFPGDDACDWKQTGWQTAETGRQTLGTALTGMMQQGEVSRAQTVEIARLLLRRNALKLYA